MLTLKQVVNKIKRKYKRVSPHRFLYNKPGDLRNEYQRIRVYILIHAPNVGYSVFDFTQNRGNQRRLTVSQWTRKFTETTKLYGDSVYKILTQKILPAIRKNNQWRFISLIGWTGDNGIPTISNSKAHTRRTKTAKKRNPNASHTRRNR